MSATRESLLQGRQRAEALLRLRDAPDNPQEYPSDLPYVMAEEFLALWEKWAELTDTLRRVYMWASPPTLKEDRETCLTEVRLICREALGVEPRDG